MTVFVIVFLVVCFVSVLGAILEVEFTINDFSSKTQYVFSHWNLYRVTYSSLAPQKDDKERIKKAFENGGSYTEKIF